MGSGSRVIQGFFVGGIARVPRPQPPAAAIRSVAVASGAKTGIVQPRAGSQVIPVDGGRLRLDGAPGHRLPDTVQRSMESLFRTDFSDVRVHSGPQAPSIGAVAFTIGSSIYFAPGAYAPGTPQGQQLLAHELTHVVQQRAGRVRNPHGAGIAVVQDLALEREADHMAARAGALRPPAAGRGAAAQPFARHAISARIAQPSRHRAVQPFFGRFISWLLGMDSIGEAAAEGLNLGAAEAIASMDPSAHPVFRNLQSGHFQDELKAWKANFEAHKNVGNAWFRPFRYVYKDQPQDFKNQVRTGRRFLWTCDTDDVLAIGSTEEPNKHAVVAGGKTVFAAGTGSIKLSDAERNYVEYEQASAILERSPDDLMLKDAVKDLKRRPRTKPGASGNTVELDFFSGHYHPTEGWRKTTMAWAEAGFFVEKDATSRYTT
jgi:hypothetical protein